ncbi:hypothetical protein LX36DRAFT_339066 [Colletotrichum falcatum]|nr:hypothetical protein LX36DRAFT_339066 [Colletotrichum falcatum]
MRSTHTYIYIHMYAQSFSLPFASAFLLLHLSISVPLPQSSRPLPHCLLPACHAAPQTFHRPAVRRIKCMRHTEDRLAQLVQQDNCSCSLPPLCYHTVRTASHRDNTNQPTSTILQPLARLKSNGHIDLGSSTRAALETAFVLRPHPCCAM